MTNTENAVLFARGARVFMPSVTCDDVASSTMQKICYNDHDADCSSESPFLVVGYLRDLQGFKTKFLAET